MCEAFCDIKKYVAPVPNGLVVTGRKWALFEVEEHECLELNLRIIISEWGWKEELVKDPQTSSWRDKRRTRHHHGNRGASLGKRRWLPGLRAELARRTRSERSRWEESGDRWQIHDKWTERAEASTVGWEREEKMEKYDHHCRLIFIYWLIYILPCSRKNSRKLQGIQIYSRKT